jgi:osmotically-inducible protein OsmY
VGVAGDGPGAQPVEQIGAVHLEAVRVDLAGRWDGNLRPNHPGGARARTREILIGRFGPLRRGTPKFYGAVDEAEEKPMKTDNELREDVEEELEWEPSVDERRIGVAARDGIVTLTGHVSSYAEKWNAERAVERVEGVKGIANEIQVRLAGQHSDTDIARAAADALEWNSLVPSDRITIRVENGWVTLRGEVDYDYERRAAERAVRYLDGVRGVSNQITVTPQVEPKEIKKEIERTFHRQAVLDAKNITVQVDGGEVILRGSVRSWAERYEAEKAAWSAPGTTSVKNYITVNAAA